MAVFLPCSDIHKQRQTPHANISITWKIKVVLEMFLYTLANYVWSSCDWVQWKLIKQRKGDAQKGKKEKKSKMDGIKGSDGYESC